MCEVPESQNTDLEMQVSFPSDVKAGTGILSSLTLFFLFFLFVFLFSLMFAYD